MLAIQQTITQSQNVNTNTTKIKSIQLWDSICTIPLYLFRVRFSFPLTCTSARFYDFKWTFEVVVIIVELFAPRVFFLFHFMCVLFSLYFVAIRLIYRQYQYRKADIVDVVRIMNVVRMVYARAQNNERGRIKH